MGIFKMSITVRDVIILLFYNNKILYLINMFNNALFNRNNNNKKLIYRSLINLKKHFNIIFEINSKISTSDIIKCIIYLMQMVEEYNINGINKKEIVLYTMKNIILEYKNNIHAYEYIENLGGVL